MEIASIKKEIWTKILVSNSCPTFEFLALQLLLFRLRAKVRKEPATINSTIEELKAFFNNNKNIPSAIKDLEKLIKLVG